MPISKKTVISQILPNHMSIQHAPSAIDHSDEIKLQFKPKNSDYFFS